MNTKKISLTLFLFLLLVLLVSLVNAQEDFTVTSLPSIELCPCSNQAYAVTVQNTGSIASSYTVLAGGSAAEWIKFNPSKFILNPNEKGSFFVFVNSRCNIEGDYGLEIFVTTNNGLTKVIRQALKFSQCYDFSLEQGKIIEEIGESVSFLQHDGSYSLCKDEQKSIPVLITNNENFENRYKLFLDAPKWATLNVDNVRLDAKKLGIFLINFDTTDVEEEEYNFKLSAISELGKVQRKKNVEVNVEKCYALEVELEKEEDDICGTEYISYDVSIRNLGTLKQLVEIEVDGPDWVGFEITARPEKTKVNQTDNETKSSKTEPESTLSGKKVLQLNPDEEKIVELNMNPGNVSGNFEITVHATPDNKTEFRASDTINVNVIEKLTCYEADISMKTSVNNYYSHDVFSAKVRNDGIKKTTYDVSLEGVDWVSVSPKTLELNPDQTGNLNLNVNPAMELEPGTYGVKINLESNDMVYSKNVDIVLKKESESAKKLKAGLKLYQYYIYLLILIVILIVVFRKPIKKRYEKYKVKEARLKALKLAREKRAKEIKKKVVKEEKKEKPIKKEFKLSKKYKAWRYIIILLFIIAIGIFIGHQNKLFNAKYLHIYIKNFFIGYLYYILIGIGVVIVLFLLILLFNLIRKKGKKKGKVKREIKKTEKKIRKKRKWSKVLIPIIIALILIGLVSALSYFDLFKGIKDFFILYQYYFILGIVVLIVIIFLIRFYKPLFKFFRK